MSQARKNKSAAVQAPIKASLAPSSPSRKSHHWRNFTFGAALILLVVFAIYFPVLHGEFLWDDSIWVTENPLLQNLNGLRDIWFSGKSPDYLPVTGTSFWIEYQFWNLQPTGYHVVNIGLHALAAILLWRILLHLKIPGALFAALCFAAHPVCVASVAWITERKNTLSLVFFLLSLLFYFRDQQTTGDTPIRKSPWPIFYGCSLAAFLLALLSKSSIVMLPVVLLGIEWWQKGRIARRDILKSVPFFLLALGFGLMTIYTQKHNAIVGEIVQRENLAARLAESARAVWFYFWKILVPTHLTAIYPHWELPGPSPLSFLPLAALVGIFIFLWKRRNTWGRHGLLALGFFVAMLFPVLGFIDMYFLIFSRVADHWQYVPLMGIVVFAAAGISYLLDAKFNLRRNARAIFATAIVFLLSALSWNHAKAYASEENLWSDTIQKNPKAWMAYNNLGRIFYQQGKIEKSIGLFTESLRLHPNHAETHNNFGLALTEQRKLDRAVMEFSEAIRLKPAQPKFHFNLGIAFAKQGIFNAAISAYNDALKLQPNYAAVHNNLSSVLNKVGRNRESLEHSLCALQIKPNFPEAHYNAANAFVALGKMTEAAEHFSAALKLRPNFSDVHCDWGIALAMDGKFDEAARHFSEVLRLNPNDANAHTFLANTLAGQKKFDEAIAHYEIALRLQPNDAQTHFNLANTLAAQGKLAEAKAHYSEALRLKPDYAEAKRALGL